MRSVYISRHGPPEVLEMREETPPRLGPNEVRVRVAASGVNFADLLMRMGLYPEAPKPPFVPGYEFSGEIVEIGAEVQTWRPGDTVFGMTRFGGYTDEITARASQVRRVPSGVPVVEAAAIPVNFLTAWFALMEMARVRAGDRVLVHSAAGGVGTAAVQIATAVGAQVVGVVGSEQKRELVTTLGAAEVLLRREWVALAKSRTQRYDCALDPIGGENTELCYQNLAQTGRMVVFGISNLVSGERRSLFRMLTSVLKTKRFHPVALMMRNRGVFGLNLLPMDKPRSAAALEQIEERFESGTYRPVIGKTFALSEAADAHRYMAGRGSVGKILLVT